VPTFRALDLDHDVAVVVRVFGEQKDLQPLFELSHLLRSTALFRAEVLLHFGVLFVLQQLAGRVQLDARAPIRFVGLDDLPQRALLTRETGELLVIGRDLGTRHLCFDLAVPPRNRFETVDHAASPALSSSPSRALLKATMATSSMSSDGWRVVNFWVPSTGSSATLTNGL